MRHGMSGGRIRRGRGRRGGIGVERLEQRAMLAGDLDSVDLGVSQRTVGSLVDLPGLTGAPPIVPAGVAPTPGGAASADSPAADAGETVTVTIREKDLRTGVERIVQRELPRIALDGLVAAAGTAGLPSGTPTWTRDLAAGPTGTERAGVITPAYVFGPDGRTRVGDTTAFPFSAVVQVAARYDNGDWGRSSGAMVSPFHVLTAAHCVSKSSSAGGGFANSVRIAAGNDGAHWGGQSYATALQSDARWFGEAQGVFVRSYSWSNTSWNYDIALVTLDRSIGSTAFGTGYFDFGYNTSNAFFYDSFNSAGYPADINANFATHYQFHAFDPLTAVYTHLLHSNRLDINPGNSGGPLWAYDGTSRVIYGVASHMSEYAGVPQYNAWTRITQDKFDYFLEGIRNDFLNMQPTNRPDLIDWDRWFNSSFAGTSTSSVAPGQPFSVTSYVRNNGTDRAFSFSVRYRLSADTVYDTGDAWLGDVAISGLEPLADKPATYSTGAFPGVAPGSYYVVWQIDALGQVGEFDEFANTGFVRSPITVTAATFPEMDVRGNGTSIADGDATPSTGDHTDFGSVTTSGGAVTRTFTIANTGTGTLSLTGTPRVQIGGAHAADFAVTLQPGTGSVGAGGTTTFQVTFDPTAAGLRTATVSIASNDANENPYDFAIQGSGTLPGAEIRGFKWNDLDGDAVWDGGEPALAGWTIYLDLDRDGTRDAGEPSRTTASDGSYAFTDLAAGTYTVAEVAQANWQQTYPGPSGATVREAVAADAPAALPAADVERALQRAADLTAYAAADLAGATRWVVQLAADGAVAELAAAVSARLDGPAPFLPDTYVLEFPAGTGAAAAALLAARPEVVLHYPLVPREMTPRFVPNDPLFGQQWHLRNTGQTSGGVAGEDARVVNAWDTAKGAGVVIGVVDDGLQHTHPDLAGRYAASLSFDFVGNDSDPTPPTSTAAHGTAAAGVAAATGNNGLGVSGVAPAAGIAGLRLLSNVDATDQQEAAALGHRPQDIDIYTNSWGPPDSGTRLEGPAPLTLAALRNGVQTGRGGLGSIYVWAAGNGLTEGDNVNYDGYANSRYTIAVSAIDDRGMQSYYSEPGAPILVAAHSDRVGVGITTTDLTGSSGYASGDYTSSFGGTSSAAPLVAGVTALMLEANPALGWRDVQHVLVNSARRNHASDSDWATNGAGRWVNHKYGFGAVDASAAVSLARTWTNVGPEVTASSPTITVAAPIPDNNATGLTSSFTVGDDVTVEWVEVVFDATHLSRGNLEVTLTSPSGTRSVLAARHADAGDHYVGWTFTSARHWGESAAGRWSLTVADREAGTTGNWNSWKLNLHGTARAGALPGTHAVTVAAGTVRQNVNFGGRSTAAPEIDVRGNGTSIADGDATPSLADHTDFGSADTATGASTRTFTIANSGTAALSLPGAPRVQVGGAHAADFTVTVQPPVASVAAAGSTTFQVRFDPSAAGLRTATLSIANDDANENPYDFTIQGTGIVSAAPEIDVRGNGTSIADGDATPSLADHTDFGLLAVGAGTVVRTFTIANPGSATLVLTGFPLVQVVGSQANDFQVTLQPASSVAPGATTTFQVSFTPLAAGTRTATILIPSGDADENPFDFVVTGTGGVPSATTVIDDGSAGFSTTGGGWRRSFTSLGYGGAVLSAAKAGAPHQATWEFTNLLPGRYEVLTTWRPASKNGSRVPYTLFDGQAPVSQVLVNQRFAPDDRSDGSWVWERLGIVSISSGVLRVSLDNATNGTVVADAVCVVSIPPGPEIQVSGSGFPIEAGDSTPSRLDGSDFGIVDPNGGIATQSFGIDNLGTAPLNLTSSPAVLVTGPHASEFTVTQQPSRPVAAGGATVFTIAFDPTGYGLRTATVSIVNDDADEGAFQFTIAGTGGVQQVIDDRGSGFSRTGSGWTRSSSRAAYAGSLLSAARGAGASRARWDFDGVGAGQYVVFGTWRAGAANGSNVPFTIFDGGAPIAEMRANQRVAPDDDWDGNWFWERLATVTVSSGTLRVSTSNAANGTVIADAVRIVKVGAATPFAAPGDGRPTDRLFAALGSAAEALRPTSAVKSPRFARPR